MPIVSGARGATRRAEGALGAVTGWYILTVREASIASYSDMARPHEPPQPDPLAFLLTWATYGTWLPGDERGWTKYRAGQQPPSAARKSRAQRVLREAPCYLDARQRRLVEQTIALHCRIRNWELFAVNCRTNHVHVVLAGDRHPRVLRNQLKAWCTRALKEHAARFAGSDSSPLRQQWWAERGSQRYINNEEGLEAAIQYVLEAQDAPH